MIKKILTVPLAILLLSACANSQAPSDTPTLSAYYQDKLAMELQTNLTDKQRTVLDDGWVTDEEWAEMTNDFHACLEPTETQAELHVGKLGYKPSTERQAEINRMFNQDSEKVQAQIDKELAIMDQCARTSIYPIGLLYFEPRSNPDGLDLHQAIHKCFQENGITDLDGIPEDELFDYIFSGQYNYRTSPERIRCVESPTYGEFAEHNN